MQKQLADNIPLLRNVDFSRLRLFRSTSRGNAMEDVGIGIPASSKGLLNKFKGTSSKRVFLYLSHRPRDDNKSDNTRRSRSPPAAASPDSSDVSSNEDTSDSDLQPLQRRKLTGVNQGSKSVSFSNPYNSDEDEDEDEDDGMQLGMVASRAAAGHNRGFGASGSGLRQRTTISVGEVRKNDKDTQVSTELSSLVVANDNSMSGIPPFLPFSFKEVRLQAHADVKGLVAVILDPTKKPKEAIVSCQWQHNSEIVRAAFARWSAVF
ncbi:hypothetical protein AC249_AIPGENE21969 [Exaiptasia diaphana]|nr:hypothetical protein AC249_AIPGENE21969 [Exaiptasia diaphana]